MAAALVLPGLVLPGLVALTAHAENAPEGVTVAFKYLNYEDAQSSSGDPSRPGSGKRMKVNAPSFGITAGLSDEWGLEAAAVYDSISGASPQYHSTLSGASGKGIKDERTAADAKLTRYFSRSSIGFGVATSSENDYKSNALSVDYRISSDDNNTTYAFGAGYSSDKIQDSNGNVIGLFGQAQKKKSKDFMFGVTQNLTPNDIIQSNLTYAVGKGYFDDPYKTFDKRPDTRNDLAWLTRLNHYYSNLDAALHVSYRLFSNNWGMHSHTLESEWHQQLSDGWKIVPALRYYSQNSADFYSDLDTQNAGAGLFTAYPGLAGPYAGRPFYSADTRLSAFGAITPGIKVSKEISKNFIVDVKAEYYQQRASWRLGGNGSTGIEPWHARFLQMGFSYKF